MYEAKVKFIKNRAAKSKFELRLFALLSQNLEGNYMFEAPGMEEIYNRTVSHIHDLQGEAQFKYIRNIVVERKRDPAAVEVFTVGNKTNIKAILCCYVLNDQEVKAPSMKKQKLDFGKFKYAENGVCTNPDIMLEHFSDTICYRVLVSQCHAGWLMGYSFKDSRGGGITSPSIKGGLYPTGEKACLSAAECIADYFSRVKSKELKLLENYIQSLINNDMAKTKTDKSPLAKGIKDLLADKPAPDNKIEVHNISLDLITPSKTNPRKTFDKVYIGELADSMKPPVGLLQPITLRELADGYEIAFGECRYRAAQLLKWKTIPAIIKHIADDELLALQIIENLQREDVNPIDEAAAFKTLLKTEKIEWLASRIHKTLRYIMDRLKLNDLIPEAIDQVRAGVLPIGHAVAISKLEFSDQKKCITKVIGHNYFGINTKENYCKLPLEDLKDFIAAEVMTDFDKVNFDPSDATLYETAGACSSCPKRTSNNNLLFADITKDDKCTDAACFAEKINLHVAREKERNKEKHGKVLSGEKDSHNSHQIKVQGISMKFTETPTKNSIPVVYTKAERWDRNILGTTVYVDSKVLEAEKAGKETKKSENNGSSSRGNGLTWQQREIQQLEACWENVRKIESMSTPKPLMITEFLREKLEAISDTVFIAFATINGFPGTSELKNAKDVFELHDKMEYDTEFKFKKVIIDHIVRNYATEEVIMMVMLLNTVKEADDEQYEDDEDESYGFTWKQMMDIIHPAKPAAAEFVKARAKKQVK